MFIGRDENGTIFAAAAGPMDGIDMVEVADSDPELLAFLNPPPPIAPISRRQFFQQAAIAGIITENEALAAVTTGALPASVTAFINTLPSGQQFGAKMLFAVNEFNRSSAMADAFGQSIGMTPEQIDTFFLAAANL